MVYVRCLQHLYQATFQLHEPISEGKVLSSIARATRRVNVSQTVPHAPEPQLL